MGCQVVHSAAEQATCSSQLLAPPPMRCRPFTWSGRRCNRFRMICTCHACGCSGQERREALPVAAAAAWRYRSGSTARGFLKHLVCLLCCSIDWRVLLASSHVLPGLPQLQVRQGG